MSYMPTSRDFDLPKNRYAAIRMGLSQPRNRPTDASDLHRLSRHLVALAVFSAVALAVATLLPGLLETLGNVAALQGTLSPAGL